MEYLKGLLFILIAANLILSAYLSYSQLAGTEQFCLTGKGCSIVQKSEYSRILGIPISYIGLTSFLALFLFFLLLYNNLLSEKLFLAACYLGTIFAIYFFYLQAYAIKAYCSNCLATELIMFLITGIATYNYFRIKKN